MRFAEPLIEGRFLKRYKRFFADVEYRGQTVVAHVPNTGSLKSCLNEGAPCLMSESKDPARKLKFTLQMVKTPDSWVGINTSLPNELAWEAWQTQRPPHWLGFDRAQREAKISDESRMDLVMWDSAANPGLEKFQASLLKKTRCHFVEIKNVTLREGDAAQFPDAVTTRGQKHLMDLMNLVHIGHSAEILFTIQRTDFRVFRPADAIDPEYGRLLREAQKKGVRITPLLCHLSPEGIHLDTRGDVVLQL